MLPLNDDNPTEITPVVTIAFIVACVLIFFYQSSLPPRLGEQFVFQYGAIPALLFGHAVPPSEWGPTPPAATLLTSMFLHGGWMHLFGNMLYLWIFGDNVEDRLGHARYLLFYLFCGAVAALGQTLTHPASTVPMIGASGAVAGVMGAYFVFYPHSRVLTAVFLVFFLDLVEIPAIYFLGVWLLMQLFNGVGSIGAETAAGAVAFWAHVVGFAAGGAFGSLQRLVEHKHHRWEH